MVNYKSFSINEAAKLIGISVDELIELGIQKKIRMGVYARGWRGVWCPDFNDDSKHGMCLSGIDENGRETYCRRAANGELVCLKEVHIVQYWHVHHSSLYPLLTGHSRDPMDVYIFEAVNIHNLVSAVPDCYTKYGYFRVHKNRDENPSTLIGVDDLRILQEEIERLKSSIKPVSELVRNEVLEISHKGLFASPPEAMTGPFSDACEAVDDFIASSGRLPEFDELYWKLKKGDGKLDRKNLRKNYTRWTKPISKQDN